MKNKAKSGAGWLNEFTLSVILTVGLLIFLGCSHGVNKADVAATANPTEEVSKLENEIGTARNAHVDVLAAKDFRNSEKSLAEAKSDLKDNESQQEILDDVAYGKAYLQAAQHTADGRREKWDGVLNARQMAITAGARNHAKHQLQLGEVDDNLRSLVDENDVSAQDYSKLQTRYMNLELAVLKTANLGEAIAKVEGAKTNNRAAKDAPRTFSQAEMDLKNAENMIIANRSSPEKYAGSVAKANASAQLLVDVLTVAHRVDKTLDENTALGIVTQNRKIVGLEGKLGESQQESQQKTVALDAEKRKLDRASEAIGIQQAMESARKQFSSSEAEVYQQGEKLLIRLKAMNFPSGRAELPAASLALLAKVKDVASELNPEAVLVEGHTDSVGTAQANNKLSQARAQAVATYLENNGIQANHVEAVGHGFQKPIATNKTSSGRSQNRRVDVIVTPKSL